MIGIMMSLALVQADASAWGTCLGNQVGRLAAGRGTPEAIADQAMRACRSLEQRVRASFTRYGSSGAQAAENTVAEMRERMRRLAISTRAQLRGNTPPARAQGRRNAPAQASGGQRTGRSFNLVNHYNSPVVRFQANAGSGWSSNWLNTQVAPYATRNLRFTNSTGCNVRVRVVFADQVMVQENVNFCGKSSLNVTGDAAWAE